MHAAQDLLDEVDRVLSARDPERARIQARLDDGELFEQALFEIHSRQRSSRPSAHLGRYAGRAHRQLFEDLWEYAWPVIKSFIRDQRMGEVASRYGAHVRVAISPEDMVVLANSAAERDALALDVIAAAVPDFERNALLKRRWSPTGGASLRTWFIGACALRFTRAYRRWSKDRGNRLDELARRHGINLDDVGAQLVEDLHDLGDRIVSRLDLTTVIDTAKPMTKQILLMIAAGMTQAQIAGELGLTTGAVEARLRRFRRRVLRAGRDMNWLIPGSSR